MFRRRRPRTEPITAGPPAEPAIALDRLADDGWVLPRSLAAAPAAAGGGSTAIGTVGSPLVTSVDPRGLVVGEGWSLDWWVGADDRWHVPAREPAARQDLLADAPVVETLLRIPGGDAVHRAFGIRAPRGTGDEWVVSEIENRTPVPLAIALVVRPFVDRGVGAVGEITIEPVEGGRGPDTAHLVRIDGRPSVVLPRRPSQVVVGSLADGDVLAPVSTDPERTEAPAPLSAAAELPSARCEAGLATMALVFPVPHTALLRAALPVGEVDRAEAVRYPTVLPDATTVASGWEVHRRGPRFELPDGRLQVAHDRARAAIHLAHDGEAVRRDGRRAPQIEPGATELILGAFDVVDRPSEVGSVVARWIDRLADPRPEVDAVFLTAIARHWLLHRVDPILDWMLPEVAAGVERIDRADRRGQLTDPVAQARAARAVRLAADLLGASGQPQASASIDQVARRLAASLGSSGAADGDGAGEGEGAAVLLERAAAAIAEGDAEGIALLDRAMALASTTGAWPMVGADGIQPGQGQDLAASAGLVLATRALLVAERPDGLALLPVVPDGWYGGGIEVHEAPTAHGVLSYAIRWHGLRPALLWELVPHEGGGPVRLTVPGFDAAWSTTELRGDALLGEVEPPEGIELVREVAEHPGLQEHMRPEGPEPDQAPPTLPEGGTFS